MAFYRATHSGWVYVHSRDVGLLAGELVELSDAEAQIALSAGWVEPVDRGGRPAPETPETKVQAPVKRKRAHV